MENTYFSQIHKYLLHNFGSLTDLQLQGQELISGWPSIDTSIFIKIEAAARAGDAYAATICSAIFRAEGLHRNCGLAFEYATRAASAEFPPGMAELSYCHQYGCGTDIDLERALHFAEKSACQGYGTAACNLAIQYSIGQPFGRDYEKAISYAQLAEKSGEAFGAYLLGLWYEEGVVVGKNLMIARMWYKRAALKGSGLASVRLAVAYTRGDLGVQKNTAMALSYEKLIHKMNSA